MTSFGPGSEGVPFAPTPGFTYAGDAWCYQCSAYVPAETNGQVRLGITAPPEISVNRHETEQQKLVARTQESQG